MTTTTTKRQQQRQQRATVETTARTPQQQQQRDSRGINASAAVTADAGIVNHNNGIVRSRQGRNSIIVKSK